jgi:hypothetical protein
MTRYEQINDINERFIITYGRHKVEYLRDKGFFYLFTGFNTNSHGQFWVYDSTSEIKYALDHYADKHTENEK